MAEKFFEDLKRNRVKIILYIVTVILAALLLVVGHKVTYKKETAFLGGYEDGAVRATVTEVLLESKQPNYIGDELIGQDITIVFDCEILSGDMKGITTKTIISNATNAMLPIFFNFPTLNTSTQKIFRFNFTQPNHICQQSKTRAVHLADRPYKI